MHILPTHTLTSVDALVEAGLLEPERRAPLGAVGERYAVAVTPTMAALAAADPDGPVARQFIPDERELLRLSEESDDPISDGAKSPIKGIVHRYPDRVLLKPLHACPVYCRFCFRREMVGPGGEGLSGPELQAALDYIRATPAIWEVVITGGDPMMLSARRLRDIVQALGDIAHVGVVRLHTRVPVVDPARVTDALIDALTAARAQLTPWVALHVNHADELTDAARAAIARLADAGIPLVSQTVLLRGINADVDTLDTLFRALVRLRVKPYYLHHPDMAPGTSHFRLPQSEGLAITRALRRQLSGLAQPTYIWDVPGASGKIPVDWVSEHHGAAPPAPQPQK
jgi:lysine 2,3-aminomutase